MRKNEMFQVISSFNNEIISEDELKKTLEKNVSNYNYKNYHYYLSDLYRANYIYKYDKGVYKLCNKREEFNFSKSVSDNIVEKLRNINPGATISIWSLSDIFKFMSLQMFVNIHFVETYSYSKEIVLNTLIDQNLNAIYEEDYLLVSKYIKNDELFVIRTINEDSPINKTRLINKKTEALSFITMPKIEKVLVDIIISKFFDMLLGDEINTIVENILTKYKISISTCIRYATKKNRIDSFKNYLKLINFNIKRGEFE